MPSDATRALNNAMAKRLKDARQACGLSLQALSDRTEGALSKSRISNYEQGIRRLSIEAAQMLASALGSVSVAHLLCLDEPTALAPRERDLVAQFRALDEPGRSALEKTLAVLRRNAPKRPPD